MGKRGATTEQCRIDNCLVYLDLTLCVCVCVCVKPQGFGKFAEARTEEEVSLRLFFHSLLLTHRHPEAHRASRAVDVSLHISNSRNQSPHLDSTT